MAIKTKYICDRCEASKVDDPKFLVTVRVTWGYDEHSKGQAQWCEECRKKFGLVSPLPVAYKSEPAPTVNPTFEELVRAIVREELSGIQQ
jgi:hypothetical protein